PVGQGQRGLVTGVVDLRLFEFVEAAGVRESCQGRVDGLLHGGLVQGVELICHLCPSVRVVWTECLIVASLSSPVVACRAVSAGGSPPPRRPGCGWLDGVGADGSTRWGRLAGWGRLGVGDVIYPASNGR